MTAASRHIRIVLNGKSSGNVALRTAVKEVRDSGHTVDVRVTWEGGDAARFAAEAIRDDVDVIVAAGGDGTVNEVANGVISETTSPRSAMAVIPFGTANDFANGCRIPLAPRDALLLAAEGEIHPIDVGRVNDQYFLNVASGGFGAEVTANTPKEMKDALGGAAYSLMGVVTAMKMRPYQATFSSEGKSEAGLMLIMSVGNGKQCGGGFQVAPNALLDDGLLDVLVVHDIEVGKMGVIFNELLTIDNPANQYVSYVQVPSLQIESDRPLQLNLDGEPVLESRYEFNVLSRCLPFVLPADAPLAGKQ